MRGKPQSSGEELSSLGLIPAYAGKTRLKQIRRGDDWAHPRVCGENVNIGFICKRVQGSSPRMRGKRAISIAPRAKTGLIPAYAGKTGNFSPPLNSSRAHPRVCGEN